MRWKYHEEDAIGVAILQKFGREVAAVAVKDQKPPLMASFGCCMAIEHLLKPGKPQVIV
jgi:hypothetical protein